MSRILGLAVLISVIGFQTGCNSVKRRMIIRTQPEGALVSIDRRQIGHTPVAVPFTYYGTRQIQIEKDGYQSIDVMQRVSPPVYDSFPISLFTENFAVRERRDDRLLDFQLVPKEQVNESLLIDRAQQMRQNIQRGTIAAPISR